MKNKSKFYSDAEFEAASMKYIKQHKLLERVGILNADFIEDSAKQKAGCDIIADIQVNNEIIPNKIIDVKSIAGIIPTFSQEIINSTSKRVGWIMNDNLETEFYLFVWHEVENPEGYSKDKAKIIEDANAIVRNRLCLVKKENLKRFIEKETGIKCTPEYAYGIMNTIDKITTEEKKINYYQCKDSALLEIENGKNEKVYITRSNNIYERPINFIVREEDLKRLGKEILV